MLDNAVEASEKETSPEIIVKIARKRNYETVLVKNRIGSSVLKDNPGLASSKADSSAHGMGVPQIKSVCEKYGGMCDFYEEEGFFCASSFIPV